MKEKHNSGLNIGISSVLVVFILLCLVTFATLSLVNANADYRLSSKIADHTTSYYEMTNQVEEKLAEIDNALLSIYQNSSSENDYYARLSTLVEDVKDISLGTSEEGVLITYLSSSIDDQAVKLILFPIYPDSLTSTDSGLSNDSGVSNDSPASGNSLYQIRTYELQSTGDWEPSTTLNLLDEENFRK